MVMKKKAPFISLRQSNQSLSLVDKKRVESARVHMERTDVRFFEVAKKASPLISTNQSILAGPSKNRPEFYIEQRPDGQFSVRRPNAERASTVTSTQKKGIEWAKEHGDPKPHVERVRHTPKGAPDKWRKG